MIQNKIIEMNYEKRKLDDEFDYELFELSGLSAFASDKSFFGIKDVEGYWEHYAEERESQSSV